MEERRGNAVRGVALVGVELNDYALVHEHAVFGVGLFGVVGMHRVSVVRGEHERGRGRAVGSLGIEPEGDADALHHVIEECGIRALLGAGADLLVIEHAEHIDPAVGLFRVDESAEPGPCAFEVVEPGAHYVLAGIAHDGGLYARVEEEIRAQQVLLGHARGLGNELFEAVLGGVVAEEGHHIGLRVVLEAVVYLAVHVDGDVRYHEKVAIDVYEPRFNALFGPHDHAPRNGKGPVKPRGEQHPAVFFNVELGVFAADGKLRVLLDLESGGIGMRRDHAE